MTSAAPRTPKLNMEADHVRIRDASTEVRGRRRSVRASGDRCVDALPHHSSRAGSTGGSQRRHIARPVRRCRSASAGCRLATHAHERLCPAARLWFHVKHPSPSVPLKCRPCWPQAAAPAPCRHERRIDVAASTVRQAHSHRHRYPAAQTCMPQTTVRAPTRHPGVTRSGDISTSPESVVRRLASRQQPVCAGFRSQAPSVRQSTLEVRRITAIERFATRTASAAAGRSGRTGPTTRVSGGSSSRHHPAWSVWTALTTGVRPADLHRAALRRI